MLGRSERGRAWLYQAGLYRRASAFRDVAGAVLEPERLLSQLPPQPRRGELSKLFVPVDQISGEVSAAGMLPASLHISSVAGQSSAYLGDL